MENRKQGQFSLQGQAVDVPAVAAGLYLVATPIGNLDDISIRALKILAAADLIACEDTRTTRKLLNHYAIKAEMLSYNDVNGAARRPELLDRLNRGEVVALVSDAGTPLVSDPGHGLVREAIAAEIDVISIPGASAALAALVASDCATDQFLFAGFLSSKAEQRRRQLANLREKGQTLIIYEAPNRIAATLAAVAEQFGSQHRVSVARELTKRFESHYRGRVSDVISQLSDLERIRGEIVLVIDRPAAAASVPSQQDLDVMIEQLLPTQSTKQIAQELATTFNLPRRSIYQRATALKAKRDEQ